MRKLIFIGIFMNAIGLALSQEPLFYTEIVTVDSLTTDKELYTRALVWFAEAYNDSETVIKLKDNENYQIIGKALMPYEPTTDMYPGYIRGNFEYQIKIFCKNGRYKYEIGEFIHQPTPNTSIGTKDFGIITNAKSCDKNFKFPLIIPKSWKNEVWIDMQNQINDYATALISNLKEGMLKKTETKVDNW